MAALPYESTNGSHNNMRDCRPLKCKIGARRVVNKADELQIKVKTAEGTTLGMVVEPLSCLRGDPSGSQRRRGFCFARATAL